MSKATQNRNVLGPQENVSLTQEQLDEYIKCSKDQIYFTNNYVKIRQADGGNLVLFKTWAYQNTMLRTFAENRFSIALCPRQSGKTESVVSFILHYVLFNKNMTAVILTNKEKLALDILARIKLAYENLPDWLKQGAVSYNKGEVEFTNGSRIMASATSKDAGRGFPISLLYLDEFGHVPAELADEFYTSVYPTVSSGKDTKIIISSTPNGLNLFYKIWKDATEKRNNYVPIEVGWWEKPGRDETWKQRTIKDIGEVKFDQEFNNQFIGSSQTLISGKKLRTMAWSNPLKRETFDRFGNYSIYKEPMKEMKLDQIVTQRNHQYLISADVSHGQGLDFSAFQVLDITEIPYKQVAKFRHNNLSPLLYPTYIVAAARHFNDAYVLIEVSDIGQQVADIIHYDLEYENLVKIQVQGKKGMQIIDSGAPSRTALGVRVSSATKKIGCANLKTLIEEDKLLVCDDETILEFATFVAKKESYAAASDKDHDDLVMCLVNASWLFRQDFFREIMDGDVRKMLVREHNLEEDYLIPVLLVQAEKEERLIDHDGTIWSSVEPEAFRLDPFSSNIDYDKWGSGY